MRAHTFELSTDVFHFYGSADVLRKTQEFYGRATFLRNSDGLYYGRATFLRNKLATVSTEQLFFLRNDRRFTRNDCRILRKDVQF